MAYSKQGLILYAQNYKRILNSTFVHCFVSYGLLVPFFFIAWMSSAALVNLLPDGSWFLGLVSALLFTWSLKKAFLEPLMITAVKQLSFRCIEGQVANPAWEAKLDELSGSFRTLADKARSNSHRIRSSRPTWQRTSRETTDATLATCQL